MKRLLALALIGSAFAQPAFAAPQAGPDLRCMAAYLYAVGQMADDPKVSEADKAGTTAIVMYFFGKVRGVAPKSDVKTQIKQLVEKPDYLETQLKPDIQRCGDEFNTRGKELEAFGDE